MRITLYALGSTGDVRPMLLLGQSLRRRGHTVTLAAFAPFRKMAEDGGLGFYPVAGDVVSMMDHIMKPGTNGVGYLVELVRSLKQVAPVLLADLVSASEDADAMACNFFGSMFYSVAELRGIPCMQVQYAPVDPTAELAISSAPLRHLGRGWNRLSYRLGYRLIGAAEKWLLTDWRKSNGMSPRKGKPCPDYTLGPNRIPVVYALSEALLPRPKDWPETIAMNGFWLQKDARPQPPAPELEDFLRAGEPPIYIGFGSMVSGDMEKTFGIVIEAVRRTGLRVLLSGGWSGLTETNDLPENLFLCGDAPHISLFPRCCGVVHHGGLGTTAEGLRWGCPTLVIPFGGDQPIWARCVYERGYGPKPIPRTRLTAERLAAALIQLHDEPSYRVNARRAAEQIGREDGVSAAADLLERTCRDWIGKDEP